MRILDVKLRVFQDIADKEQVPLGFVLVTICWCLSESGNGPWSRTGFIKVLRNSMATLSEAKADVEAETMRERLQRVDPLKTGANKGGTA